MTATIKERREGPSVPVVRCPKCGRMMRFAAILPTQPEHDQMVFDCSCGFDFRLSDAERKVS